MIQLIDIFETTLSENNGSVMVNYKHDILTGYCEYRIVEVNNRFKQRAWVLINTDMGDIIEYIHTNMPLSDDDLLKVDKLIRDHSLSKVQGLRR
jgi:hypothetical protein